MSHQKLYSMSMQICYTYLGPSKSCTYTSLLCLSLQCWETLYITFVTYHSLPFHRQ
jgi:hypothetical protein